VTQVAVAAVAETETETETETGTAIAIESRERVTIIADIDEMKEVSIGGISAATEIVIVVVKEMIEVEIEPAIDMTEIGNEAETERGTHALRGVAVVVQVEQGGAGVEAEALTDDEVIFNSRGNRRFWRT